MPSMRMILFMMSMIRLITTKNKNNNKNSNNSSTNSINNSNTETQAQHHTIDLETNGMLPQRNALARDIGWKGWTTCRIFNSQKLETPAMA